MTRIRGYEEELRHMLSCHSSQVGSAETPTSIVIKTQGKINKLNNALRELRANVCNKFADISTPISKVYIYIYIYVCIIIIILCNGL